jgi:AcrR family transcriptional regulator
MPKAATRSSRTHNQIGQKIGSKGHRTRQLLIDTTVELLATHGLRDLSVVDVARAADTSPATFYVYFRGVPEAVLAALENASQTSPEIEALIAQDWMTPGAAAGAIDLVVAFTEQWNRHRTIFRVRNLAGEEGDARFIKARTDAAQPIMRALTQQVGRAQEAGRAPAELSAPACAATILMILERLAAVGPVQPRKEGLSYAEMRASTAFMIAHMLGARV